MSSRNEGVQGWGRLPAQEAAVLPETKAHIQIPGKINSCCVKASSLGGALASRRTPKWARDGLLSQQATCPHLLQFLPSCPSTPWTITELRSSCRLLPHFPHPALSPTCLSLSLSLPSVFFPPSLTPSFILVSREAGSQDKSLGFQVKKVMFKGHKIIKGCKCYPKNPTSIMILK